MFRNVTTDFWTDPQVVESFTPEDKFFWLYILTNPHTNICGVLRVSTVTISAEMGYSKNCIENLIYRFLEVHKMIYVDESTGEIFAFNWWKYNWSRSPKMLKNVRKQLEIVKSEEIIKLIFERLEAIETGKSDMVSIPYRYHTVSVSVFNNNSNTTKKDRSTKKKVSTKEQIEDIIKNYSCTEEVKRAIKDYLEMRDSKGAKPTVRAVELMLKRLDKLSGGDDALKADILDQSTMNSWTGLFAFKGDGQKTEPERESAYPVLRFPDEEEE